MSSASEELIALRSQLPVVAKAALKNHSDWGYFKTTQFKLALAQAERAALRNSVSKLRHYVALVSSFASHTEGSPK